MFKHVMLVLLVMSALVLIRLSFRAEEVAAEKEFNAVCAGKKLGNVQARNQAMEDGYSINAHHDCIEKSSFAQVEAEQAASKARQATERTAAAQNSTPTSPAQTLAEARAIFRTSFLIPSDAALPLPTPPVALFVRSDYTGPSGAKLAAFVSPNPQDGKKHPAIIWLTGGDSNSVSDFWTPGPPGRDESASPLREAGIVMMFPTLRGGNTNPGKRELFYGEVDDVLAAAEHLARLPWVDPAQIYLGGHSTGGTLALLTSEMSGRFAAVFALGPVAEIESYNRLFTSVDLRNQPAEELRLRSPIHWLHGILSPTYLIEGTESPNSGLLDDLCAKSRNPQLHCIRAKGMDHFSVVNAAARVIATRIMVRAMGFPFALQDDMIKQ